MTPATTTSAEQVRAFVDALYDDDDLIEARQIKRTTKQVHSSWHRAHDLPAAVPGFIEDNEGGFDIYFGCNPRRRNGGTADDVLLARNLVCDFDGIDLDEVRQRIADLPEPTAIIATGHGFHIWWRLDEPIHDLDTWTNLQKDAIAHVGSDPAIHDPSRIMRPPGFTNHKPPVAESCIIEIHPERVHDLEDMTRRIPERPERAETLERRAQGQEHRGLEVVARAAQYLAKVPGAIEGQGGDAHTYATACKLRDFGLTTEQALPLLREWNASCSPPWTEADLREKLDNAWKYGKNAPGCKADSPPPSRTHDTLAALPTDTLPDTPAPPWFSIREIGARPTYKAGFPPISTGYAALDDALNGGFRPEATCIFAGRTGTAKSTLLLNIARRVALNGRRVLFLKLEESLTEAVHRLHAAASQVPLPVLLDGIANHDEHRAELVDGWHLIRDLPVRFSDCRHLADIQRLVRKHAEQDGALVIIDQLSMVTTEAGSIGYERATIVSNALRLLARETRLPIVCVSQVNRPASKNKSERLTCHDIRDSGELENDAAAVLLIDKVRVPTGPVYGERYLYLDIIIGKNRYGHVTGPEDTPMELTWYPRICRIEEVAR